MREQMKERLFSLLSDSSQTTSNEELQSAYENFVKHVEMVGSDNDYEKIYRNLSITRIEFASLESILRYEQGGKCA